MMVTTNGVQSGGWVLEIRRLSEQVFLYTSRTGQEEGICGESQIVESIYFKSLLPKTRIYPRMWSEARLASLSKAKTPQLCGQEESWGQDPDRAY